MLYLSPRDYHRVHVPREGSATAWRYIAGSLWPVFPAAVRRVDQLFARNERAIVTIETDQGPLQVVLGGAFGVGRITLQVCDLMTNTGAPDTEARTPLCGAPPQSPPPVSTRPRPTPFADPPAPIPLRRLADCLATVA